MKIRTLLAAMPALLCIVHAPFAHAQSYPAKPVRFITASAGSPQDVIGRLFAAKIAENWGQSVVVENRAGAGALISIQAAVKSPADGYSVLVSSTAFAVTPSLYPGHGYDSEKDLIPVALLATAPNILVTSPVTGIRTLREAADRARAGKMQYGSPGFGTTPQLSAEYLFKILARVPILHVPYKGIPPLVAAALSGEVEVASMALPPAVPLIKAGRLIGLAVTTSTRTPALPDVPTIAEAGFAGFSDDSWVGVWVPAGTPAAVVSRLRIELDKAAAAPEVRERLASLGFEIGTLRSDAFGAMVKREIEKWAEVVKDTGAKAE